MATKKAFPHPMDRRVEGMDLRDWFAGQALPGLARLLNGNRDSDECARRAYLIADAMMEARGK
jgi:hypothetical protein